MEDDQQASQLVEDTETDKNIASASSESVPLEDGEVIVDMEGEHIASAVQDEDVNEFDDLLDKLAEEIIADGGDAEILQHLPQETVDHLLSALENSLDDEGIYEEDIMMEEGEGEVIYYEDDVETTEEDEAVILEEKAIEEEEIIGDNGQHLG